MLNEINENIAKAEALKKDLSKHFSKYNVHFSKLDKESKKESAEVHSDLNKAMRMLSTGEIDEEFIKSIQSKYANKNS
jgi:F0F1-type ATP synthase membrane subunit b/b'